MIDNISRNIISILRREGRTSNVKLAQELGVNAATVAKRIEAMLREELIFIRAIPNPFKRGYQVHAFITLKVDVKKVESICAKLVDNPNINAVVTTFGRFDIIILVDSYSWDELVDFVEEDISRIGGINEIEINFISEIKKRSYGAFADDAATNNMLAQLDDIDRKLIEELGKNGRLGYADLAKKLGVSSATVSRRVSYLIRENIVKIVAMLNPSKLGLPAHAFITLHVERSNINDICAELANYTEVHTIMTLINGHEIIIGVHFATPEMLYNFILEKVAYMDGVLNIETLIRAELKKSNYIPDIPY